MPQIYDVLKQEHREIEQMLDRLTQGRADGEMFGELYSMLEAHQQAEEKTVYPDLMQAKQTHDIVLDAIEEHHVSDLLLKELRKLDPKDERWQPKMMVLKENVHHHIQQEEQDMFAAAKKVVDRQWAEQSAERFEQQEQTLKQRISGKSKG